jgi:aminoglycoside phosphotransferase (APT) family kinase protein
VKLREIEALLELPPGRALFSSELVEVRLISTLRGPDSPRAAFRIELADGRRLKLRHLPSAERGRFIVRTLDQIADPRFARVLLQHERLLVEEWVEGLPIPCAPARDEQLAEAGHLLGKLHALRSVDGEPVRRFASTLPELDGIESDLAQLVASGALAASAARQLGLAARERDPGQAEVGVVHRDFCAENMITDGSGRLRVIDNDGFRVGPLDLDLENVWNRWPMAARERDVFLSAYATHRDPRDALRHAGFWRVRAVAKSARLRIALAGPRASVALEALRRLPGSLAEP